MTLVPLLCIPNFYVTAHPVNSDCDFSFIDFLDLSRLLERAYDTCSTREIYVSVETSIKVSRNMFLIWLEFKELFPLS